MSSYLLDTNILVGMIRGAAFAAYARERYALFDESTTVVVSIVSVGEIWSLAYQLRWGRNKRDALEDLLQRLPTVNLSHSIARRFAEIDAFSQGKLEKRPLPAGVSSRNMGKNDLWIAATASLAEAVLVTCDRDFEHLDGVFCAVARIDPAAKPGDLSIDS
jgi:tRNA(fMet)-specific endonuclease VapC